MDIGKSFSYPFEDKEWLSKLGLGALIAMVPIINFAWTGYMVALVRNMLEDVQEPLPNWDDFGKKLVEGFMLFLVSVVYTLPVMIVACLPLSIMIVPAILSGNQNTENLSKAIAGATGVLFIGLLCLFVIYAIVLSIIFPAIVVRFAREGTFASCFQFREVFDLIGKNTGAFFTAWGVSLLAGLGLTFGLGIAQVILNFIPCIGQIIAFMLSIGVVVYASVIYAHLFGQFGRLALEQRPLLASDQPI